MREEILTRSDLAELPKPLPLIEGVLDRHTITVLTGRGRAYKTSVALDWALCIATGNPWQGCRVERGPVLYIAGEGAQALGDRITAWESDRRTNVDKESFQVLPRPVNLYTGIELDDLLAIAGDKTLVVIDTLRRASGGADGNSSDMGVVMDHLDKLKRATADGTVLTLVHTDWHDTHTRGFSGIEDDADTVWHSRRDDDNRFTLTCRKRKNGPDGTKLDLQVQEVGPSLVISSLV